MNVLTEDFYAARERTNECIAALSSYVSNRNLSNHPLVKKSGCAIWDADAEGQPILVKWKNIADHPKVRRKMGARA